MAARAPTPALVGERNCTTAHTVPLHKLGQTQQTAAEPVGAGGGYCKIPTQKDSDDNFADSDPFIECCEEGSNGHPPSRQSSAEESPPPSAFKIAVAAAFYSACAATLLVFNKLAVHAMPSAAFVVATQLLAAALVSRGLGVCGVVSCGGLEKGKVKQFLPVTILFTVCLYTNVQALAGSSVNTVIVTRACVSVFVALLDAIFLRMGWPSVHTWVALAAIFAGAVLYALTDKGFSPQSYAWLSIYFFFICAEMVVVKHIVDTVGAVTAPNQ
jgi:hypothetical protein